MSRKVKAFTLIELLVVISIIAVLVAFLMPALSRAREQAKIVVCQSRVKQLTLAFNMYMDDYNQKFPTLYYNNDPSNSMLGSTYTYTRWGGVKGDEYTTEKKLLNRYVGVKGAVKKTGDSALDVFKCPSDRGGLASPVGWGTSRLPTIWENLGYSYSYNVSAISNNGEWGLWNKKLSQIRNPKKVILVADASFSCYGFGMDPFLYYFWHNREEMGWGNVAFVDLHIKYMMATNYDPYAIGGDYLSGKDYTFLWDGPKYSK